MSKRKLRNSRRACLMGNITGLYFIVKVYGKERRVKIPRRSHQLAIKLCKFINKNTNEMQTQKKTGKRRKALGLKV